MVTDLSGPLQLRQHVLPADIEAVRRIVTATQMFHEEEIEIAVELVQERLSKGTASGYEFVFAVDASQDRKTDTTVAYACYGRIPCTESSFDLYWIAVDPAVQGRGIGRQLLKAVESHLQTLAATQLYADTSGRADYAQTRAFYQSVGFDVAARLAHFYAPGDEKIIYAKSLPS